MVSTSRFVALLIASLTFSTTCFANVDDFLECTSSKWHLTVGVNSIPDNSDTLYVTIDDKIDGGFDYNASIPKNSLKKVLAHGVQLQGEGSTDVAHLKIVGHRATFHFQGIKATMVCKDIE